MVGDWIMYGDKPVQVLQLTADKIYRGFFPIPLTSEMLEKNGFKPDGSGQKSYCLLTPFGIEGLRYNIYVGLRQKTIEVHAAHKVLKKDNWRKVNKLYLEVCGPYVHELQHALKLCGIDKEITL